jgi:hypothetical protein
MRIPGIEREITNLGMQKLNGRSDFIGKLHNKLTWGWELWTKDGYDVITPSDAHTRAFNVRSGDWVIVFNNRLWFPYTTYTERCGLLVSFAKFKVGDSIHHMLSLDDQRTKADLYSSVSAVYAHTIVEADIRPLLADKQRKAWQRWVETKPVRARLAITELTNTKTEIIDRFISKYSDDWQDRYVITSYSSYGPLEIQLRLAFAHLRNNAVLRYLWNKHHYCGLRYVELYNKVGALYNDQICIVSVPRASLEASKADRWVSSIFPEDILGIPIRKPISNMLMVGCMNEKEGTVDLPYQ